MQQVDIRATVFCVNYYCETARQAFVAARVLRDGGCEFDWRVLETLASMPMYDVPDESIVATAIARLLISARRHGAQEELVKASFETIHARQLLKSGQEPKSGLSWWKSIKNFFTTQKGNLLP